MGSWAHGRRYSFAAFPTTFCAVPEPQLAAVWCRFHHCSMWVPKPLAWYPIRCRTNAWADNYRPSPVADRSPRRHPAFRRADRSRQLAHRFQYPRHRHRRSAIHKNLIGNHKCSRPPLWAAYNSLLPGRRLQAIRQAASGHSERHYERERERETSRAFRWAPHGALQSVTDAFLRCQAPQIVSPDVASSRHQMSLDADAH